MVLIAGVDPGLTGAIAVYDVTSDALVAVWDIPTVKVGTRQRIDGPALNALGDVMRAMDVKLVVVERVQGWGGKGQGAAAAFAFGEMYGRIASVVEAICEVRTTPPHVWKMREKISTNEKAIVAKADADFPQFTSFFHGPRGGLYHDRAEAAFLARFGARRIWPAFRARETLAADFVSPDVASPDVDVAKPAASVAKPAASVAKPKRRARKTLAKFRR